MPLTVSNLSLTMLEAVRLREEDLANALHPVFVETRNVTGYFPALELKRLIAEREDLSYLGKVNRNLDRSGVPGFSFIREGAESLNEYIKQIAAAPAGARA